MISALIFLGFLFLILQTVATVQVPYGGQCNETARCDTRTWLHCLDGTCSCPNPEEMKYEGDWGKCVGRIGKRCIYYDLDSVLSASVSDVHPCVKNAKCNLHFGRVGVCTCEDDFYLSAEGTCEPTRLYGESCDETLKCSTLVGLVCNSDGTACNDRSNCSTNMCTCGKGLYWRNTDGKCLPKIGFACSNDSQCDPPPGMELKCVNGKCDCDPDTSVYASVRPSNKYSTPFYGFRGYVGDIVTRCVPLPQLPCKDGLCAPTSYCEYTSPHDFRPAVCKCEPGLTLSRNGKRCARELGGDCTKADDCIDGLVCRNQICSCEFDLQDFDKNTWSCRSRYKGPCTNNTECTTNSYCEMQESGAGHCVCEESHIPSIDDFCRVPHGGLCEKRSDCDDVAALECVNNVCVCGNFNSFRSADRKCVRRVGARCSEDDECTSNAHCHKAHPILSGHCVCDVGSREAGDYTCLTINQTPDLGATD